MKHLKLVFKLHEEVYVAGHGKGTITHTDQSARPYFVVFDASKSLAGWHEENSLSFEPWPAPVHVRPLKVGWYVVWIPNHAHPYIYHWNGEKWNTNNIRCSMKELMFHKPNLKYLGEELKHD